MASTFVVASLGFGLPLANAAQPAAASDDSLEEVVVTGSLVRGIAPIGTNVSSLSAEDIQKTGATSTNQILSQIPAVTNAFNVVAVTPASLGRSTYRPDLRNLGATGSATTLVLMDGHNLVGAGILQTTADAGVIPPGALERVEVVSDGGSSIYGSDAIGGIINFITRKTFKGIEISGHGGFAKGYHNGDLNVTVGHDWDGGSLLVSGMARYSSELSNSDRDLPRQDLRPFGGTDFRGRTCPVGTIIVGTTTYALPGRVAGTVNQCDTALNGVTTPLERQYAGFVSLTQKLADRLDLEVKVMASKRGTRLRGTQISDGAATINNTNPFFQAIGTETQHNVALDFSSVLGKYIYSTSDLTSLDVTPTLTYDFDNSWRAQTLLQYGSSETIVHVPGINSAYEASVLRGVGLTRATALNPYDLTQTDPLIVNTIANFENYAFARQWLATARFSADGNLFALPGGDARLAVGAQIQNQRINALSVNAPRGVLVGAATAAASRDAKAAFAQLVVPVFGSGNAITGFKSLDLDMSLRSDNYENVGNTTNYKFGLGWQIVDGVKFRGNVGSAFNAPSLADSIGAVDTRANIVAQTNNIKATDPASDRNRPTIQLAGGNPNLKPQKADTWSAGLDLSPQGMLGGLDVNLTYWSVTIKDQIGIANTGAPDVYTNPVYAPYFIYRPTLAQAQAATQGMVVTGATSIAALYGSGNDPYLLTYSTRQNLGTLWVKGVDAHVGYRHDTSWGRWNVDATASRQIYRKAQSIAGAPIVDQNLSNRPLTQGSLSVGATYKRLTGQVRMNWTSRFAVIGVTNQSSVEAFAPINLSANYSFSDTLDASLNIDNVFDKRAPFANVNGGTLTNAGFQINSTLGRFVNLGVRKRF